MSNNAVFLNTGATTVTVGDGLTGDGSGGDPLVAAVDGTTVNSDSGSLAVTDPLVLTTVQAAYKSTDGSAGATTTITTASLVGKTVTVKNGIITSFA